MKSWKGIFLWLTLAIFAFTGVADVLAKGSRSSSRSSYKSSSSFSKSKSSSSKSSYKSTKPSASTRKSNPGSIWGSRKSNGSGFKAKPAKRSIKVKSSSGLDKKITLRNSKQRSSASKTAYTSQTAKFKKAPAQKTVKAETYSKSKIYQNARPTGNYNHSTYYRNRDNYYSGYGWHTPSYAYMGAPSFGMWDSMMLWMLLDNMNKPDMSKMAYNHANDPGFQEWKKEATALSADNKELKAKLDAMDAKLATMSGPVDPDYLPASLPAAVALSAGVMATQKPEPMVFKFGTASKTGNYYFFGDKLSYRSGDGVKVKVQETAGSWANLVAINKNEMDGCIAQSDVIDTFNRIQKIQGPRLKTEQTVLYSEPIMLISNRNSKIKSMDDLKKGVTLYVGNEGSGTAMTWEKIRVTNSKRYGAIKGTFASYDDALNKVMSDKNSAMLIVTGLNSSFLNSAEKKAGGGSLRLVTVNDSALEDLHDTDGNRLYRNVIIPKGTYPNLQKGWFMGGKTRTLAVDAVMMVRTDWVNKANKETKEVFTEGIVKTMEVIDKRVGALQES